ncbi:MULTISPECIES: M20 metallopeptidase family protein [Mesorhizobium]|uniref:Peptidase dimerization domain-containing protein n=3 Tax=Phyllobacteriaceae TaxID=69277 RepID=A0ABV1YCY3_9HYPH|nr:peptidase dimerization domain-containing protein [Mesorhizobium sp.]
MSKPEGSVMADGGAISGAVEIDAGMLDRMIEIRRHLHRNPELSNHEANTHLYLRQMLAGQGIADIRDVAGFGLAVDIVGTGASPYTLACDTFDAVVTGSAAHAAKPHEGVDALAVACSLVTELQKIVSREIDPYDPLVISVTAINGGNANNVSAGKVALKGTIRSGSDATRERVWRRVRAIAEGMAASHGAHVEVDIHRGEPGVVNDVEMAELIVASGKACIGADNVLNTPGWTVADDFGYCS